MRRADRLFSIVQLLRRYKITTATKLAEKLEVSERTIYRDIRDLATSGVPIRGEAGVGYAIDRGFDMPPLMFNIEEIEALVLGARMVESWYGNELGDAARDVIAKVEQVLPRHLSERLAQTALFVPDFGWTMPGADYLGDLRIALRDQRKVLIKYQDVSRRASERTIRPLGLFFWGKTATLGAWCELRHDFRNFRVDRIVDLNIVEGTYENEPGRSLHDYYRVMAERYEGD